mgnify:CR=1 FL=1
MGPLAHGDAIRVRPHWGVRRGGDPVASRDRADDHASPASMTQWWSSSGTLRELGRRAPGFVRLAGSPPVRSRRAPR